MAATFTDMNQVEYEIISPVPDGVTRPNWYEAIKRVGLVPTYVRVLYKAHHIDYATVGACHWCALLPSTIAAAQQPATPAVTVAAPAAQTTEGN